MRCDEQRWHSLQPNGIPLDSWGALYLNDLRQSFLIGSYLISCAFPFFTVVAAHTSASATEHCIRASGDTAVECNTNARRAQQVLSAIELTSSLSGQARNVGALQM